MCLLPPAEWIRQTIRGGVLYREEEGRESIDNENSYRVWKDHVFRWVCVHCPGYPMIIVVAGGRIHSLITHPLSWAIARDVTCIGLAVVLYRKAPPNARIFVGAQLIALANLSLALRLKQFK